MTRYPMEPSSMPSPSAGAMVEVDRFVRPATIHETLTLLTKLVAGFDIYDDADLDAKLSMLAASVEGEPPWAIKRAVDDFCFGRVKRRRSGLPQAHEFAPHVEGISAWAREKARIEAVKAREPEMQRREHVEGDGIEFGMSKEEQRACGRYFADEYMRTKAKNRTAFFTSIRARDIQAWLARHRS